MAVFAALIQLIFLSLLPHSARVNSSMDFVTYYNPVAQNFLNGKGLTLDSGEFGTRYPAGFPLFLAGSYLFADALHVDRIHFVIGANLVLMTVACVLVYSLSRRVFGQAIAVFSALLWSTYIFNLWLIKQPNSEVPFIPLLLGAVYCLVVYFERLQAKLIVFCGLLVGISALIRPIVILLPLLLSALVLFKRNCSLKTRALAAGALLVAFALTILPWEAALFWHTGHLVALSTNGAASIEDGLTFTRRSGAGGIPKPAMEFMGSMRRCSPEMKTTGEVLRCFAAGAAHNPLGATALLVLKAARSWFGTDSGQHELAVLAIQAFYLLISLTGFVAMARNFRVRHYELKCFVTIVFYFWAMSVIALSILRYMVPAMAFLLIPGAAIPALLVERYAGQSRRTQSSNRELA